MTPWLDLPAGRLRLRLHLLTPLLALALVALGGDLWLRYLLLLASVLLHELGHATASLVCGGRRTVVRLWPVFGLAEVETFADRRTAWVALSGPLVNLVCAGVLALAGGTATLSLARSARLDFLFTVNLLIGLVNLVPIPPIDGGRALRALWPRPKGSA